MKKNPLAHLKSEVNNKVDLPEFNTLKHIERPERSQAEPFFLSDQALAAIMCVFQKGISEMVDVTEVFRALKIIPGPNKKLYVVNPPSFKVTPEMEDEMKQRYIKRLEGKAEQDKKKLVV